MRCYVLLTSRAGTRQIMADIGKDAEKQAAGSLGSEILQIFQENNCLFQHLKMLFCDKKKVQLSIQEKWKHIHALFRISKMWAQFQIHEMQHKVFIKNRILSAIENKNIQRQDTVSEHSETFYSLARG